MIAEANAPSDCHGSPVCALDGLARLGAEIAAMVLGVLGLIVLAVAAGLHRHHVAKREAAALALPRAIVH